jgi:hypothetical protein
MVTVESALGARGYKLVPDVEDVEDRRPVWHGVASKNISESDRKDSGATVQAAVDAILVGFPPT